MQVLYDTNPPSYEQVREDFFNKYERKINAIIQNIESNSLRGKDKVRLKKRLARQLLDSIE